MSWPEVFSFALLLGIGSSAHCAGMCGVFAIKAASGPGRLSFLAYILGKVFTYAFLGALAGWFGARVISDSASVRAYAALIAAATLILAGILALVPNRAIAPWTRQFVRMLAPVFAAVRTNNGLSGKFALGATTGLLPCGIVYVAAVQAVLSGTIIKSVTLMGVLGLSTAPALLLVGYLSERMTSRLGPRAIRVAGAVLLIVIGSVTAWRALGPILGPAGTASCCH